MQYLEAYKQAAITSGPADELEEHEKGRAAKEAQPIDSYNSHNRLQSLMEKHQAKRSAGGKLKKFKSNLKVGKETDGVAGKQRRASEKEEEPWKPWDGEKDIAAGRTSSVKLDPKNFKESLSSRFEGSTENEPRKFLQEVVIRPNLLM